MSSYVTNEALQRFKDNLNNDSAIRDLKFMKLVTKMGLASDFYNIGNEIIVHYTYKGTTYNFTWVIVDFKDVEKEDGKSYPATILGSKYTTIEALEYDHPEANNNNANIKLYGDPRYRDSAVRQWLNSDAGVGQWWTAKTSTDVAPDALSTLKGFKAGFSSHFLSILSSIKVQTQLNDTIQSGGIDVTYDMFWLPSVEEVYGVPEAASGNEGTYYKYWKSKTELDNPSNAANSNRIPRNINNTALRVKLRSSKINSDYLLKTIGSEGAIGNSAASVSSTYIVNCAIS